MNEGGDHLDADPDDPEAQAALARINRFLNRPGIKGECPFCGQDSWGLVMPKGTTGMHILFPDDRRDAWPPPNVKVYTLVCNTCGFVRTHAKKLIDGAP